MPAFADTDPRLKLLQSSAPIWSRWPSALSSETVSASGSTSVPSGTPCIEIGKCSATLGLIFAAQNRSSKVWLRLACMDDPRAFLGVKGDFTGNATRHGE